MALRHGLLQPELLCYRHLAELPADEPEECALSRSRVTHQERTTGEHLTKAEADDRCHPWHPDGKRKCELSKTEKGEANAYTQPEVFDSPTSSNGADLLIFVLGGP